MEKKIVGGPQVTFTEKTADADGQHIGTAAMLNNHESFKAKRERNKQLMNKKKQKKLDNEQRQ